MKWDSTKWSEDEIPRNAVEGFGHVQLDNNVVTSFNCLWKVMDKVIDQSNVKVDTSSTNKPTLLLANKIRKEST